MMKDVEGTIYLIHFERPLAHASHYIGWTKDLDERIREHKCGSGARLLRAATRAGIELTLVRTWEGTRRLERQLKRRHEAKQLCPRCHDAHRKKKASQDADRRRNRLELSGSNPNKRRRRQT